MAHSRFWWRESRVHQCLNFGNRIRKQESKIRGRAPSGDIDAELFSANLLFIHVGGLRRTAQGDCRPRLAPADGLLRSAATSLPTAPRTAEPVIKPTLRHLTGLTSPSRPQYGHCILARNGANQVLGATYECGVQGNGTGPASRQLQDKVGGVTPAGLSLDRAARCRDAGITREFHHHVVVDVLAIRRTN